MLSNIATVYQASHSRVKDREKSLVYQEISNFAPCSRKTVAEKTGIRQMTVSRVVHELLCDGLVEEREERTGEKRGRPEILLAPNLDRLTAISLYLQSRELHAVLMNIGERILNESFTTLDVDVTNEDFLENCEALVRGLAATIPKGSELLGVAISLVGTVSSEKKIWISASRWRNIRSLDFSLLEKRLALPLIINRMQDSELEYLVQKTPRYRGRNVLFLHWGFGIGASYAYKGKVLGSGVGRFGEIGHTRVAPDSEKSCQCGAKGCLETEAALWALRDDLRKFAGVVFTDERELGRIFRNEDILSCPAVERALEYVSFALLNLHQIFYPDVIVCYGPFTENAELFRRLERAIKDGLPSYAKDLVEMKAVHGGFQGCIRGSLYEFFKRRFRELLRVHMTKI